MRRFVPFAIVIALAGCSGAPQADSIKTVAAFEVPLPSEADREEFLMALRAAAGAEAMHVDTESAHDLENEAQSSPLLRKTLKAAVWRGAHDDELIASAQDEFDHLSKVWITFVRGKNPTLSVKFRERAMRGISLRWPGALSLPIMPTGSIPLYTDLVQSVGEAGRS